MDNITNIHKPRGHLQIGILTIHKIIHGEETPSQLRSTDVSESGGGAGKSIDTPVII